uniref:helix-turn-helix transcriptional regulator n=1 Tax=Thaumasiovibrio occultus TaxID=1891184 RepID=UPI00192CF7BC|nr:YafY family protein [Thaumasiovibrio occultus]
MIAVEVHVRKSDRLFQLTNILRRHQPITAKQLAEKLKVSERTVYRYIDDLSVSGIPVYGEPGIGYRLSDGFELPPLQLSPSELEALVTGVSFTASLTGNALASAAYSLLSKIEASIPADVISTSERVVRVPTHYTCSESPNMWTDIHKAIRAQKWLTIHYQSLAGTLTVREVFPLGLFYWGGKWTLGCWCGLRGQYRDFRVDCIAEIAASSQTQGGPENVSLTSYIELKRKEVY